VVDHPELDDINRRFKPLFRYLRPGEGDCPFAIDKRAMQQVAVSHYSAGSDAALVQIGRKWDGKLPLDELAITIHYAPFVEGTTIIYDLFDETMQGKARPFACDLNHRFARMYMLLPFQVEQTLIVLRGAGHDRFADVSFLDARQEIIQAAFPLELRFLNPDGKVLTSSYGATNRLGRFNTKLPPDSGNILVRCCLTGREETA
jgi:hypothetical protein